VIPFEEATAEVIAGWVYAKSGGACSCVSETEAIYVPCADENEWLTNRGQGIGASEVGIIVGASSFMSPYALWWRKKLDWRLPRTEAMQWGHLVEDPIADVWAETMVDDLIVAKSLGWPYSLWRHPADTWMTCTPDRLAVDETGLLMPVEIKSDEGGKGWGAEGTDEVPLHHRMQVSWQAHIFGAPGGWVVRKRQSGKGRVRGYWIKYNAADVAGWIKAAADFLESIEAGEPPEPDGGKSTTEALKELHPALDADTTARIDYALAMRWLTAREEKRRAMAAEAIASNRLRASLGRAEFGEYSTGDGFGRTFVKRSRGKRTGYSVAPGETDELREVSGGQPDEGSAVSGPAEAGGVEPPASDVGDERGGGAGADFAAATAAAEERSADRGTAGEGVGGGDVRGQGGPGESPGEGVEDAAEFALWEDDGGAGTGGNRLTCSCGWLGVGTPAHEPTTFCLPITETKEV
jgi:putative phage-type endonuclease